MQETFIESYQIDKKVCKDLISYHKKNNEYRRPGYAYDNNAQNTVINKDIKDSIDVTFYNMSNNETIKKYFSELTKCLLQYVDKYKLGKLHTYDGNLIQYYPPGGGFKKWHSERSTAGTVKRVLVFMTFLNDVPNGGTMFKYQNITVPAKKGLTLIWPTDFTHTHKGKISKTHDKYIVTGWYTLND